MGLPPANEFIGSCFGFIGLVAFFTCLWRAIGKTPLHVKYASRAQRHEGVDNERAEADYGEAIRLAEKNLEYRHKRGLLFEKLGKLEEAQKDLQDALDLERKSKDSVTRAAIERDLQRINSQEFRQRIQKSKNG
jgi:tetratricopeptide (TPR) repeat protein